MQPDHSAIEAVRRQFYANGKTITDWARENGFDRHMVYSVLNGRCRAQRGESHRIAVALGLKKAERSELFAENPAPVTGAAQAIGTNAEEVPMKT